jgi:hypothetical protein
MPIVLSPAVVLVLLLLSGAAVPSAVGLGLV